MFFVDYILPILSFIIATLSAILAFKANVKSQEANDISMEANSISMEAKRISEESNHIAKEANNIASSSLNSQIAPDIKLTKLELDPTKVKIYGGNNISWIGKQELKDEMYKIILKSARKNSIVALNKKEYLLVNLCYEDTPIDDIGIVIDAFCFEAKCTKNQIAELSVLKAYSLLNPTIPFETDMQLDIHIDVTSSTITVPVAYACPANLYSSLNLGSIAQIADKESDKINLMDSPYKAGKIIGFVETAYLIKCLTSNNDEFLFTLYIKRDEDGRLKTSQIVRGDEKYNQYYKKAKERIGKEIQVTDTNQ